MNLSNEALEARRKYMREHRQGMSREAREKYNEYTRNWRRRNRDKIRQYNDRYWERKAAQDVTLSTVTQVSVSDSVTTCLECGKEFTPQRKTARFCSDNCRVRYNRKMKSNEPTKRH